jgi:hypothetical protein
MSLNHDHAAEAHSGSHHGQLELSVTPDGKATMEIPILAIESKLRDGQTLADYGREHPRPPHGWRAVLGHFAWWLDHATGGKVARERCVRASSNATRVFATTASTPPTCLPGDRPGLKSSQLRHSCRREPRTQARALKHRRR